LFRVKIVLLSVLLSGLVLAGFGFYALSVVDKVGTARIDREILTLGEGHLAVRPPREYWQNFDTSLRFIYGEERSRELVVQVRDAWDEVLFKSPHWPEGITDDSFSGFDRTMDTNPPKPDDGVRSGRRGPPPEAYKACQGKRVGSTAQFVDRRGETVRGTCEEDEGKLVLRPNPRFRDESRRPMGGEPVDRPPPPALGPDQSDRQVPRIKKKPYFATIRTPSGVWRAGTMGTDRVTIMVGVNMAGFYEDTDRYRKAFLAVVPILLILLAAGGWVIANRALRPVTLITRTAEKITAQALNQRIPQTDADRELTRLVEVINGMLDRLEKSFGQAVRFSADAAHELQTPLTILQGELDAAVQHAIVGSEEQQQYSDLLEEVQRLKAIVQKLLILARVDAGRLELRLREINLSELIESAAEDVEVMAPHLQVRKEIPPEVIINGDIDLVRHIVSNLVSNAMKYAHEKGLVSFRLSVHDNTTFVAIANDGVPIPEEEREKIFGRFYRVDQSRTRAVPGAGLGLSLAREIARAHGGDLSLDPPSANLVSFTLSLPRSLG
jgi:heavy metal sensor kinase